MLRKLAFLATLIGIFFAAGCSDDSGPTGPSGSIFPQTIRGTVTSASPTCSDYFNELEFPCQRFGVVAPRGSVLIARLTWSDPNTFLRPGSVTGASAVDWHPCSASGCEFRVGVTAEEVSLTVGLDTGRSASMSQAFEIALSLQ